MMNVQSTQDHLEAHTYVRDQCVVFKRPEERHGSLANTALGFPLMINSICVNTLEHLYHACKFPHLPEMQREILHYPTWKEAKDTAGWYKNTVRTDWEEVKIEVMRWCLRLKLAQHWTTFGADLLATGEQILVENSRHDAFWGAQPNEDGTLLVGENTLGKLLMELRDELRGPQAENLRRVVMPSVPDFLLMGQSVIVSAVWLDGQQ